jgi:predicted membrane-bound dolichyl-phosphate-mannose-protein mannosyltransferase
MGMEIKDKLYRLYKWEYFFLCVIVIATLIMHFCIVTRPTDLILDEQHYIKDARNIMQNHESLRTEHPPLAKLIIVAGIKTFGDNPWGWRVFPILFGTVSIVLFYFLCRRLNMSPTASNIAAFLLAFENLTFLQASVAMLDVFCLTFMLAAFLLYVNRRYINSGIAVGLSALAKLNGALALPVIFIHWIFSRQGRSRGIIFTILFSILSFVELMILFEYIIAQRVTSSLDPFLRIKDMLSLSGSLTFATVTHPYASHPWDWLISYKPMAYWYMPHYTAAISFTIWALIIPTFAYLVYKAVKRDEAGLFGLAWFAGTYLIWIPVTLITDRVNYIYYFYPAVGAICIGVALGLSRLIDIFRNRPSGKLKWTALSVVIFILFMHLVSFLILSPLIPVDFAKLVGLTG